MKNQLFSGGFCRRGVYVVLVIAVVVVAVAATVQRVFQNNTQLLSLVMSVQTGMSGIFGSTLKGHGNAQLFVISTVIVTITHDQHDVGRNPMHGRTPQIHCTFHILCFTKKQ